MTIGPLLRLLPPLGLLVLLGGCALYDDDVSSYGHYNGVIGGGVGADYGYGYGYGPGWYDGFYYPGSGVWAYDRGGKRHRWQGQDGRRRNGAAGAPAGIVSPGVPAPGARTDLRAQRRDRPDRVDRIDRAGPARRPDAVSRPVRAAPVDQPARPGREGRNRQERPN